MGRKKENFDPLAGPISGGSDGARRKKSKGHTFDVLGGGGHKPEKTSAYDDVYSPDPFGSRDADTRDALTPDGTRPAKKEKPGKKGFFASLFGGGKKNSNKPKTPKPEPEPEPEPESWREPEPVQTRENPLPANEPEEDLFEEELPATPAPVHDTPEPAQAQTIPDQPTANICWLCGETSTANLPYFTLHPGSQEPGNAVPLCKTCYRAVTTLMKYRDPTDEQEIKTEWKTLCTSLDEPRVTRVITEGRRYH